MGSVLFHTFWFTSVCEQLHRSIEPTDEQLTTVTKIIQTKHKKNKKPTFERNFHAEKTIALNRPDLTIKIAFVRVHFKRH